MMWSDQHASLSDDQRPKFTMIILKCKFPGLVLVLENGMNPRDRYILRNTHIYILLPPYIDLTLILKSNKLKNLPFIFILLLHDLKHNIRLFWFRYVNCVKLLVVEVDTVLVMRFAHFANEGFPVYGDAEVVYYCFYLLGKPLFQAEEVDIAY